MSDQIKTELFKQADVSLTPAEVDLMDHFKGRFNEDALATVELYSSKILVKALNEHAKALNKSAEASDRHASSLKWATWALAGATVMLVVVACLQLIVTLN